MNVGLHDVDASCAGAVGVGTTGTCVEVTENVDADDGVWPPPQSFAITRHVLLAASPIDADGNVTLVVESPVATTAPFTSTSYLTPSPTDDHVKLTFADGPHAKSDTGVSVGAPGALGDVAVNVRALLQTRVPRQPVADTRHVFEPICTPDSAVTSSEVADVQATTSPFSSTS